MRARPAIAPLAIVRPVIARPATVLLAVALLAAGCVNLAAERQAALNATVGLDEAALVRAVGVPSRVADAGGRRFLAYTDRRIDAAPGFGSFGAFGGFGPFGFYDAGFLVPVERVCETTYELAGGRVVAWTQRGRSCNAEAAGVGVPAFAPSLAP